MDRCVKKILCGLGAAVVGALDAIFEGQINALTAIVVSIKAQIVVYDMGTFPLVIARNTIEIVLEKARSIATLVPLELIAECADLGDMNISLVASIDDLSAEATDVIDDLTRLLSYKEELELLVREYEDIISQFSDLRTAIQECAQT